VDAEVFVYGREQTIIDAITKTSDRQADREYRNDLDHVFSVLLNRAYPGPQAHELARRAIDALCREAETLGHKKVPELQPGTWEATATRTRSFESVLTDMETTAIGSAKRERLINAGLTAMLGATGSRSASVLSATEAERTMEMLAARGRASKEPGILGVNVSRWPIIEVLPDTPAAEAGLRDGDIAVRVNTRDVARTETGADGMKALKGAADTVVSLTVERGSRILTFEVRRASAATRIKASVIAMGIVYIQIPLFEGSGVAERVKELVRKHVADATSGFVLDLRNNRGGRAEEANAVADIFLDETRLQILLFRNGRRIAFKSKPGALDVRVAVLTNHDTASAAEMLAIALHDNHRATVIGQPTAGLLFGKDFEKLKDGRMIVFRSEPTVLSPTGNDYSETGLSPDILVSEPKGSGEDKTLGRAIQLLQTPANKVVIPRRCSAARRRRGTSDAENAI
jgi:carboxyl-terminal processing protease